MLLVCLCVVGVNAQARDTSQKIPDGYARLLVITDFEHCEVEINHVSYPYEYIYGNHRGLLIPAGIPIELKVSYSPKKSRTFRFTLTSGEMRIIMADIKNKGEVTRSPSKKAPRRTHDKDKDEDKDKDGYLGVSSSPRGTVYVDGSSTGKKTPARRIKLDPGRHKVKIEYDDDHEKSETKYVLIRAGTNTNVFFRRRPKRTE